MATGPNMGRRVQAEGFEFKRLRLGASSNSGVADRDPGVDRFIDATRAGPLATIRRQALDREEDLLWQPERVAGEIAGLCDELDPECVLVDHVSFGSTLGMYATGRPFVTLVPGHPSQLPVGTERYGIPPDWPSRMLPEESSISGLEQLADRVTAAFSRRWNDALAAVNPSRPPVDDPFRVHGTKVLYNSPPDLTSPGRRPLLPTDHHFVGPLVRDEELPEQLDSWSKRTGGRPQIYVAFGTFLSHRSDVLARTAEALRVVEARAAISLGATPAEALGPIPDDWIVDTRLPQVAMLSHADLAIHHGGNNSVQEALSAGVRQIVLPFSTDQFANAADLERIGAALALAPNDATTADLVDSIDSSLASAPYPKVQPVDDARLVELLFESVAGRPGH